MSNSAHTIETQFKASGVGDIVNANEQIIKSLKDLKDAGVSNGQAVEDLSKSLRTNMEATYALRRGYSAIRIETRTSHMAMIEFGYTLNSVAGIGRTLNSIFNTYQVSQIRMQDAQNRLTEANKDVSYWQSQYNQYLNDFGANSEYATKAQKQLTDALDSQKQAQKNVASAQQDMNTQYIAWGLMVPGFISNTIKGATQLSNLNKMIAANGGLAATIEGSSIVAGGSSMLAGAGAVFGGGAATGAGVMAAPVALGVAGAYAAGLGVYEQRIKPAEMLGVANQIMAGKNVDLSGASPADAQQIAQLYRDLLVNQARNKLEGGTVTTPYGKMQVSAPQQSVTVYQTNNITNMADAEKAADKAYQDLLAKLKQQNLGK